eukprot:NODE_21_length_38511_cov_0.503306.p7 type:complete len:588 gc:universal NODE_21_length_38511_cov_0.503306:7663-5900(-)
MLSRRLYKNLVEIMVNNKPVQCSPGMPLIDAIEMAGIVIPRFCYHEKLNIAGNCRMCLVELERAPKPVASCSYPVMANMKVFTDTPKVKQAREGVLEFILANHPLDCPVCDQGGECDLQDQSMAFGSDKSRFSATFRDSPLGGDKRAVENKNFGPIVKTSMNRCIHCTRCVRFANDIAGAVELGTSGRGNDMQIGTYIEKTISSELSGNIVDLCPVGALTSKPYAFKSRPWELKKTESVDVLDACGSSIRIDSRGPEVMRILPRLNEEVNEEWISDKTRHACDGLKIQRLNVPMIKSNNEFVPVTWQQAFELFRLKIKESVTNKSGILGVVGQLADCESMTALKDLLYRFDGQTALDLHINHPSSMISHSFRKNYIFNTSIGNIENSDFVLIIGANPRTEASIMNIRIRRAYLNGANIYLNGPKYDLNYGYTYLGNGLERLTDTNKEFNSNLGSAKHPVIIVGEGIAGSAQLNNYVKSLKAINPLLEYNLLSTSIAYTGAYELGIPSVVTRTPKFVYLLNADSTTPPKDAFVVYQGHHGDYGASVADLILPVIVINIGIGIYREAIDLHNSRRKSCGNQKSSKWTRS